jgi:TolB-like protein
MTKMKTDRSIKLCIFFVFFLTQFCLTTKREELKKEGDTLLNFTQFDIYENPKNMDKLLGSVIEGGTYEKVYKGNLFRSTYSGETTRVFTSANKHSASAKIQGLFSFGSDMNAISQVKLTLINPRVDSINNVEILPRYLNHEAVKKKKYISSLLYAEKVRLEVQTQKGVKFDAEGYVKQVPGLKLSTSNSASSTAGEIVFAEDVYIGYKLKNFSGEFVPPETASRLSLIVLPFEVDDANKQEFSTSFQEASSFALSALGIQVLERNSFQKELESQNLATVKIVEEMRANTVLSGKIRFSGNEIRVTGRLIREDNTILPESNIDQRIVLTGKSLFDIEDEWKTILSEKYKAFAKYEVESIVTPKDSRLSQNTQSEDAYKFFLMGKEKYLEMSEDSLNQSIDLFKSSLRADPGYVKSHAALSEVYSSLYYLYRVYDEQEYGRFKTLAKRSADKALSLDQQSFEANRAMGLYYDLSELEPRKAQKFFETAIKIKPDDPESKIFLTFNQTLGRFTPENKQKMLDAYNLNPNLFYSNQLYGYWLKQSGSVSEALEKYDRAILISPRVPLMYSLTADLFREVGNFSMMVSTMERANRMIQNNYYIHLWMVEGYKLANLLDNAIRTGLKAASLKTDYSIHYTLGELYKLKGNKQKSSAHFKEACEKGKIKKACK